MKIKERERIRDIAAAVAEAWDQLTKPHLAASPEYCKGIALGCLLQARDGLADLLKAKAEKADAK